MFERFTTRARHAVVLAQDEARELKHNYIGTEHLLLGLLREEEGVAARVLETRRISLEEVRAQVARIVGYGDEVTTGQIPFTPRAKRVLELALQECLALGHTHIGTEHVLLGLVRVDDGLAAQVLLAFGADADAVRSAVLQALRIVPSPEYEEKVRRAGAERRARPASARGVVGLAPHRYWLLLPAAAGLVGIGILVGWLIWG